MPIAFEVRTLKALPQFRFEARVKYSRRLERRNKTPEKILELTVDTERIKIACCDAIRSRGGPMSHNAMVLNCCHFFRSHSIVSTVPSLRFVVNALRALHVRANWPSCLRQPRKERAGARLVVAIAIAARAQHLRFQRRDAGDVDQDPVHEDRRQQRRQTPRIGQRDRRTKCRSRDRPATRTIRRNNWDGATSATVRHRKPCPCWRDRCGTP